MPAPEEPPAGSTPTFRSRLARNTAVSIVANGWTMVLALTTIPLLLGGLGSEAFGVWALIQTASATNGWLSVTSLGLAVASGRLVAAALGGGSGDHAPEAATEHAGRAATSTMAVFAAVGLCTGLAVAVAGPPLLQALLDLEPELRDEARTAMLVFSGQTVVEHLIIGAIAVLEGAQRVAIGRSADAVRKTLVAVAVCTTAALDRGLVAVAWASAAATLLGGVVVAVALARLGIRFGRPGRDPVVRILRYGATISSLTATGVLHRTMDRLIAGAAFGPSAVSLVEIANQVQVGCSAPLAATTYPVLSSAPWLHARGETGALRELVRRATAYSVGITLPLVVTVIVLAGPFVRSWVGSDFSEAIGLVQLAVAYLVLAAPLQAASNALQGLGLGRQVLVASFASVLVNLLASLVLVEVVGLAGVFLGTMVGAAMLVPILGRAAGRATGFGTDDVVGVLLRSLPLVAASAAAAAIVLALGLPDIVALTIGGTLATTAGFFTWRARLPAGELGELGEALRRRSPVRRSEAGRHDDEAAHPIGGRRPLGPH